MQVFPPNANAWARLTIVSLLTLVVGIFGAIFILMRSAYRTGEGVTVQQPVQFSHEHHVSGLGIRCQYCHTAVSESPSAGMPATYTCMTCHSQVWTEAPELEPVRESFATGQPIFWNRVHNLADFVYFNHSIHVNQGVGCSTCHGRIDQMPLVYQAEDLSMGWCLNCHEAPEQYLRPIDEIYNMEYQPPANQAELGQQLVAEYQIDKERLTNCYTCHR